MEEEEQVNEEIITPFRTLLHRAISFLQHQEEHLEQEMLNTAIENSLDSYRESLFTVCHDDERKVNLTTSLLQEDHEECHLCLEDLKKGDCVMVLPCSHLFHAPCIQQLVIHQHIVCPLCRRSIPLERSSPETT